ncbi:MAG: hypothetical protein ACOYL5_13260 [Phototrophicaceae bacterium]|jgi:hypothetical protein
MVGFDAVKLLMQWDIKAGRDQEYFEFVVREWVPGVTKLGLEPTGAWYTVYSREDQPQILAEGLAESINQMREILQSDDWHELHDRLLDYVDNYTQKVVRLSGGFQL